MARLENSPNPPFLEIYMNWFQRLRPRERSVFIVFAVVLTGSLYFNGFLKGTFKRIAELKKEYADSQRRYQLAVSDFPDLDQARRELETTEQNIETMRKEAADIESHLISPEQIPQVLTELVKYAQGLSVDFQSVKQKTEEEKGEFLKFYVDCRFDANYENAANYIQRVERMSPFIKLTEVKVSPAKSDPSNLVSVSLQLMTTMMKNSNREPQAELSFAKPADKKSLLIERSPLTSGIAADEPARKETLKVTGITYRTQGISTAIVNDTVVKVGDEVEGQKIESILLDSVVINEDGQSRILKVER